MINDFRAALADRYRVERELGQGGMATVYLAHDLRHDRQVALKVLRPDLAAIIGGERFLAEIKTTANLQHPHILPLHDSGTVDGTVFYVMPFVDGESLRDRLTREKQLPVDDAVRIAREVADALGYAHQHHVIHRDIKPENILLQGGHALVADFGIALAASATAGTRMTETGMSLGTPTYMSPEQAMGDRSLDARTDIYALGCVVYEMLTGDPPFTGSTAQAIVAKVLTSTPEPITTLRKTVPPHLEEAVLAALAKLPADRPASAAEFSGMLAGQAAGRRTSHRAASPRFPALLGIVATTAVLAALAGWYLRGQNPVPAPLRPVRFLFTGSDSARVVINSPWTAAISPDGGSIVYLVQDPEAGRILYSRRIDQLEGHPIPGTQDATQPIFSPDGTWVAYHAAGKEMKVRLDGSPPLTIATGGIDNGADWTTADELLVGSSGANHGLSHVGVAGGSLVEFTQLDSTKGEIDHLWPIALPDGRTVVFAIFSDALANSELAITSLEGGGVTRLGLKGIRPLAVLDGQLVYLQADGAVMAVPLDAARKRTTGTPVVVHDPVFVSRVSNGNADIYMSPGGALTLGTGTRARLSWIGRDGSVRPIGFEVKDFASPRLSPDERRLAVIVGDGARSDVWVRDFEAGTMSRVTNVETVMTVEWSADGTRIVYTTTGAMGRAAIWAQAVGKDSVPQRLADVYATYASLAPDGHSLLIEAWRSGNGQLQRVLLDSGGVVRPFLSSDKAMYLGGPISPNGRWVAMVSSESGVSEVFLRSYPEPDVKIQISAGGGSTPSWSADGTKLYYLSGQALVRARLAPTPTLRLVSRDTLIARLPNISGGGILYQGQITVSGDGARVIAPVASSAFSIEVVPNWITEFRERVAAARKSANP